MFDPVGVWGCEQLLGPALRGDLTVRREGAGGARRSGAPKR